MNTFESTENNCPMDHSGVEVNQGVDDNGSQLSSDDLCTRVVLKKIMQHFSSNELGVLSLVCKLWHSEARSIMEKRGALIAQLCPAPWVLSSSLVAFVSDLEVMNAAPISLCGIKIRVGSGDGLGEELDPNYDDVILDRLKWRNVSIVLGHRMNKTFRECPCSHLVDNIFKKKCGDLVGIDLVVNNSLGGLFIEQAIQNCVFPRLQTLKIEAAKRPLELNFVRALVSRAPALQKVYGPEVLFQENLLNGSSEVLVSTFEFNPRAQSLFSSETVPAISVESLILEVEDLDSCELPLDFKIFNRVISKLLKDSVDTLETVQMDLLAVIPLMNYGIVLGRVRELEIRTCHDFLEKYEPETLQFFKAFNFTRIFPSLSKVRFCTYGWDVDPGDLGKKFVDEGNAVVWEYKADRASGIKHLKLWGRRAWDSKAVQFFAHMFPNILTFSIRELAATIPCGIIREQWVNLEEISFGDPHEISLANSDRSGQIYLR